MRKKYGYWKNFDNLARELLALVEDNLFPTAQMAAAKIGSSAKLAIAHFGGIAAVAQRMGFDPPRFRVASDGHFVDSSYEYAFDEYLASRGVLHEVNGHIVGNRSYRYDFKLAPDLFVEVWGYPIREDSERCVRYQAKRAKKEKYYAENGLRLLHVEYSDFDLPPANLESKWDAMLHAASVPLHVGRSVVANVLHHCGFWTPATVAEKLLEQTILLGHFPTHGELRERGQGGLLDAAKRRGGLRHFRRLAGYKPLRKQWDWERVVAEARELVVDGRFPGYDELKATGRYDLIRAINRHGGYTKVQEALNLKPKRAGNGSWTDERIVAGIATVATSLGRMPTYSDVRRADKTLASAIDRTKKGFGHFAKLTQSDRP